jgi:hypothetical protein
MQRPRAFDQWLRTRSVLEAFGDFHRARATGGATTGRAMSSDATSGAGARGKPISQRALSELQSSVQAADLNAWSADLVVKTHEQQEPTVLSVSACEIALSLFDFAPSAGDDADARGVRRGKIGTTVDFYFGDAIKSHELELRLDEHEIWSIELVVWMLPSNAAPDARPHRVFNVPFTNAAQTPGLYGPDEPFSFLQADNPEMKAHLIFDREAKSSGRTRGAPAWCSFAVTADMLSQLLRLEATRVDRRAHDLHSKGMRDLAALQSAYEPVVVAS